MACALAVAWALPAHGATSGNRIDRYDVGVTLAADGAMAVVLDFDFNFGDVCEFDVAGRRAGLGRGLCLRMHQRGGCSSNAGKAGEEEFDQGVAHGGLQN